MAIEYPVTLPGPSLETGVMSRPSSNITIQFDQGLRIRRGFDGTPRYSAKFIFLSVSDYEMFRNFYETNTLRGSLQFNAIWEIDGELEDGVYRFTGAYKGTPHKGNIYKVTIGVELISRIPDV